MKEYKIVHKEKLFEVFFVEAENEDDAMQKYNQMVMEGKIDYSDMDLVDSSDEVEEVE